MTWEEYWMKLDYIESFLAISKYKSISQAAQSLYITQPTLTNRMKNLENYLDLKLFDRSWKGIELTEHGLLFLPQALKLFEKLDDFHSLSTDAKNIHNNTYLKSMNKTTTSFKIGMNNYLVSKYATLIIQSLTHEFPELDFEFTTAPTKELLRQFSYGLLDYIVYYGFDTTLENTNLLESEEMVIILNEQDYLFVDHDLQALKQIRKPLYVNALHIYLPYFETFKELLQIDKLVVIENVMLIKKLIQAEQGFSMLPNSFFELNYKNDDLYKLHVPKSISRLPIYSTYRTDSQHDIAYAS